ncbi:MAG TPA: prephenate dehydrogenase [Candidatus Glassbacteria bacterium]|nr:prephenate dehydrogenase [Candidatus Glassbacteria bacterium]
MEGHRDQIERITICGVGLIGGSLGLALKKAGFTGEIVGYGRPATLERARRVGAIDSGSANLAEAVADADVIYLSTPILNILELLEKLPPLVKKEALITDAGSTKAVICEKGAALFAGKPWFVGGHPMAGKETTGVESADPDLYRGARYALTPFSRHHLDPPVVQAFVEWLDRIGARLLILDAEVHDEIVTWTSHLPQIVSTALAVAVLENVKFPEDLELSAGGLRDASRLAESSYRVWRDICFTNSENLERAITTLTQVLEHLRDHLRTRELEEAFERANELRRRLKSPVPAK